MPFCRRTGLLSAYRGLKRLLSSFKLRTVFRLLSAYRGLKQYNASSFKQDNDSLLSAYRGLKLTIGHSERMTTTEFIKCL